MSSGANKGRRNDKDPVPEFNGTEEALAWMDKKLNGWTDALPSETEEFEVVVALDVTVASQSDFDEMFRKMLGK